MVPFGFRCLPMLCMAKDAASASLYDPPLIPTQHNVVSLINTSTLELSSVIYTIRLRASDNSKSSGR